MSIYNYKRRESREVMVGNVGIGGDNPIRLQSMTNVSTNDVESCVSQSMRIAARGGEIVRLTTQGVREATAIGEVRKGLRQAGCDIPVVADVHFNPKAAYVAAENTDKLCYYVSGVKDAWLEENKQEAWGDAIVTKPVAVSQIHQWLKDNPDAFIAAIKE